MLKIPDLPILAKQAIMILVLLVATYLYETEFLILTTITTKRQIRLYVESDKPVTLSKALPQFCVGVKLYFVFFKDCLHFFYDRFISTLFEQLCNLIGICCSNLNQNKV